MEEKGQLTTETVDGVLNNALMWERRSLVQVHVDTPACQWKQTLARVCTPTTQPVIDGSTCQVSLQVNLQYTFWLLLNTVGRWWSWVKCWLPQQDKRSQKHRRNWLHEFHSVNTMTLGCTSLYTKQHLLGCLKFLEYSKLDWMKWQHTRTNWFMQYIENRYPDVGHGFTGQTIKRTSCTQAVENSTCLNLSFLTKCCWASPARDVCEGCFHYYTRPMLA